MRILVACELPEPALSELRTLGDVVHEPALTAAAMPSRLADVGVLVVGRLRISGETIGGASTLQLIVHAGEGAGDIAVEEASTQGVFVAHCPSKEANAVAELTFGLILALDRQIVESTFALRGGRWDRPEMATARGLAGRTLGILGCSPAGCQVAWLGRAFGMNVIGWGPTLTPEKAGEHGVEFCNWPRDVARNADVVTVHAPAEGEHEVLVGAEFLANMKTGACLVLIGHPGTFDEPALLAAIPRQNLRVGLDLFSSEPAAKVTRVRSRLLEVPGVIGTPHVAVATDQARQAIGAEVVRVVRGFLVSGEALNCLNLCEQSPATWQLVLRVRDQLGVMAAILEAVRADGINAEEISSRVFTGARAAWCKIALDERPSTAALETIRAIPDVLHLELRAVV